MIYVWRYALIAAYTVFWGVVGVVLGLVDRSGEATIWVGRNWLGWILKGCRIRILTEGLDNFDHTKPHIFMVNHQSLIDTAALLTTIPVSPRFVAKKELAWVPFFGWAFALGGHVLIDRGDRTRSVKSLARAAARVRGGTNVVIYPEGTRSSTGRLQPFKKGGFHLAIQAQVPVIPVTVSGSQRITPKRSWRVESGDVKIVYGKPIPTQGMVGTDRHALADEVRRAIEQGFDPAYQGQGT